MPNHYPSFDVMNEQDAWDDHTQTIVTSRLKPNHGFQFLTQVEAEMLKEIAAMLVNDQTPDVMNYVVRHFDETLYRSPGEGQRKFGVPKAQDFIRNGLKAIEEGALLQYRTSFLDLDMTTKKQYLQHMSSSTAAPQQVWTGIPQKELFQKLLQMTVEAYCSHPNIWSDIGYAGPAYPRGYIRTQLGQLDPWEAQPEHVQS